MGEMKISPDFSTKGYRLDLQTPNVVKSGANYNVSYGNDGSLFVEFEMRAVLQEFKSTEAGRPIYEDVPYIKITIPGDRTSTLEQPVCLEDVNGKPSHDKRFPRQWDQFQNQQKQTVEGTPLEEWPMLGKSQVLNLKSYNIYTVEQIAALGDNHLDVLGLGKHQLRDEARKWLGKANPDARQIEALNEKIARLEAAIAHKEDAPVVKRRGRRPKSDVETTNEQAA